MHNCTQLAIRIFLFLTLMMATASSQGAIELGLAQNYTADAGIVANPAVIFFCDYEKSNWLSADYGYGSSISQGYGITSDPSLVFWGSRSMEIQQTIGTHLPMEFSPKFPGSDIAHVRFYRRWEPGYDWTQHKMPGVYAKAPGVGGGGAGIPPDGHDKYSCKLFVGFDQEPRFYTYHPDQRGIYGDELRQNIGTRVVLQDSRWYCFEMMIKANTVGQRDGELKMWIDGILKGHYEGMRFRDTVTLKINEFTHSAYVGGDWVSKKDQKIWEDHVVVANQYIGPINGGPSLARAPDEPSPNRLAITKTGKAGMRFFLPAPSHVKAEIRDASGQLVRQLLNSRLKRGEHSLSWNPKDLAAGTYVLSLTTDQGKSARHLILP